MAEISSGGHADMKNNVAILGASDKPERYSYKAFKMLSHAGYKTFLVHPNLGTLEGHRVYAKLSDLGPEISIDTLTLYVNPKILAQNMSQVLALRPRRVIFNPGTEEAVLRKQMEKAGIHTVEACTLVLLRTNQFEIA